MHKLLTLGAIEKGTSMRVALRDLVSWVLTLTLVCSARGQSCGTWIAGVDRAIPGVGGSVEDALIWDPDGPGPQSDRLVVCGGFTVVSDFDAKFVATWDGTAWSRLGNLPGSGTAYALAIHNGELYIGGAFSSQDDSVRSNLLRWDGREWIPVLPGPNGEVRALQSVGGSLIVAGNFPSVSNLAARSIARWDGASWSPMGDGLEGTVRCLTVYAGDLIAGGTFPTSGATTVNNIARWDGASWQPLAGGLTAAQIWGSPPTAYCFYQRDSRLFVGGLFDRANGLPTSGAASWNGLTWTAGLGYGGDIRFLGELRGRMIAATSSSPCTYFVNGTQREELLTPTGGFRRVLEWRGETYFAGAFSHMKRADNTPDSRGIAAFGVARWDGTNWHPLGHGMDWTINELGKFRGDVIALGAFTSFGSSNAHSVARWDGEHWHAMGEGFDDQAFLWTVNQDRLYVAGDFLRSGGTTVNHIAEWDGAQWRAMGTGVVDARPSALATFQGEVYVGANRTSNQVGEFGIFAWNGSNWRTVVDYSRGSVYSMHSHAGKLFVGGGFSSIGGVSASRIASWNGSEWEPLGIGFTAPAATMTTYRGELYVGVALRNCIYAWNAASGVWRTVSCELSSPPSVLFAYQGRLIVGGVFGNIGFRYVGGLASWDGRRWNNLGLPPERLGWYPYVYGLQEQNGELIVGGIFQRIGGIPSPNWGRWRGIAADLDDGNGNGVSDNAVTIDDLLYFLDNLASSSPYADLDDGSMTGTSDGGVTVEDLLYFLDGYAEGC